VKLELEVCVWLNQIWRARNAVIPNQFWGLSQLLILKLGHNALTELSPHVRQLTALRSLQLAQYRPTASVP
jgi:hypothetical protein